jgi:hypothetical protein
MNKQEIIQAKLGFSEWVLSKNIETEVWFEPIEEGKWAIAEIVAHFILWDYFLLKERIPFF